MQTLVINIEDDINIGDFFTQIKKIYPSLQIARPNANAVPAKKFTGIDDLKPLYVPGFKMYPREELYDR